MLIILQTWRYYEQMEDPCKNKDMLRTLSLDKGRKQLTLSDSVSYIYLHV